MACAAFASAQTITRTVTTDGRVVYSDHPVAGAVASQRTLSSAQLGDTNVLNTSVDNTKGGDTALRACQPDLARYCATHSGAKDGMECLLDHQQDVTDNCYDAMKQRMQSQQTASDTDTDKRDEPDSNGGPDNAPPTHGPGPAPGSGPGRGPLQACQSDVKKLCHDVQPGGGRLVKCLLDNQPSLSDACYGALADMKNKRQDPGPGGPPPNAR